MNENNIAEQLEQAPQKRPEVPSHYLRPKAAEVMMKKAAGMGTERWKMPLLHRAELTWNDDGFKKQVGEETAYMAQIYPGYLSTETERTVVELSDNAIKILKLQALGKTTEEIAKEVGISPATVKYHNKETYKKLGVNTKAQAINEARNRKLL